MRQVWGKRGTTNGQLLAPAVALSVCAGGPAHTGRMRSSSLARRFYKFAVVLLALLTTFISAWWAAPMAFLAWPALWLLIVARAIVTGTAHPLAVGDERYSRLFLGLAISTSGGVLVHIVFAPLALWLREPSAWAVLASATAVVALVLAQRRTWPWLGMLVMGRLHFLGEHSTLWRRLQSRSQQLVRSRALYMRFGTGIAAAQLLAWLMPILIHRLDMPAAYRVLPQFVVLCVCAEFISRRIARARGCLPPPYVHLTSEAANHSTGPAKVA